MNDIEQLKLMVDTVTKLGGQAQWVIFIYYIKDIVTTLIGVSTLILVLLISSKLIRGMMWWNDIVKRICFALNIDLYYINSVEKEKVKRFVEEVTKKNGQLG